MTKDNIQAYIRECADLFGLKDWIVTFEDAKPDGENSLGEACAIQHRKLGKIRVADNFWAETPEDQRYVIIHELTHFHLFDVRNAVRDPLFDSRILSNDAYQLLFYNVDSALERAVDGIAMSIAKWLPLPPGEMTEAAK